MSQVLLVPQVSFNDGDGGGGSSKLTSGQTSEQPKPSNLPLESSRRGLIDNVLHGESRAADLTPAHDSTRPTDHRVAGVAMRILMNA
jgi:hypothetical protein